MTKHNLSISERFFIHVEKTETCWLWTAHTTKKGYGLFWPDKGVCPSVLLRATGWSYPRWASTGPPLSSASLREP